MIRRPSTGFAPARIIAFAAVLAIIPALPGVARAAGKRIGAVDTTFRLLGRNDQIVVDRYDDPKIDGVSCYVSRAETGGIKGSLGFATDPSRFSIACRATGPVHIKTPLPTSEPVFSAAASPFFKVIRVTRIYDAERNTANYLVWSTQSLGPDGSPYNSLTSVPLGASTR